MIAPSRLTTRTPSPPKLKPPGGFRYVCHSVQPLTGQPKAADGSLILSYQWHLEGKGTAHLPDPVPPPPEPTRAPIRRGAVGASGQGDLFGDEALTYPCQ